MIKRILLGLLTLAGVTGLLGAQEAGGNAKMAISLDLFPLVKGIIWSDSDNKNLAVVIVPNFEYLIRPHFTIGAGMDLYLGTYEDISVSYFGLAAHGRWYPMSTGLDKLFVDIGLGFNVFSYDGHIDSDRNGFAGITMSIKAGYKLMFGSHFFLEPSMGYVYAKTPVVNSPTPLGWQPGLGIGAAF